jgi:hypothetical protein
MSESEGICMEGKVIALQAYTFQLKHTTVVVMQSKKGPLIGSITQSSVYAGQPTTEM